MKACISHTCNSFAQSSISGLFFTSFTKACMFAFLFSQQFIHSFPSFFFPLPNVSANKHNMRVHYEGTISYAK